MTAQSQGGTGKRKVQKAKPPAVGRQSGVPSAPALTVIQSQAGNRGGVLVRELTPSPLGPRCAPTPKGAEELGALYVELPPFAREILLSMARRYSARWATPEAPLPHLRIVPAPALVGSTRRAE